MADYLPSNETNLDAWFLNFSNKMSDSGNLYGFSGDDIKRVADDYSVLHSLVQGAEKMRVNTSEYTAYKNILLYGGATEATPTFPTMNLPDVPTFTVGIMAGIIERTRALVKRLKVSPNYNEAVGQDFQVIGTTGNKFVAADAKPVLKIKALANSLVEIGFVKGESDGIELEIQRGNDTSWMRIGKFIKTPAEDDTPTITPNTPEVRRYRGRFLEGNKPVGQFSDIASVVTTP
jgi:hypothetical protein